MIEYLRVEGTIGEVYDRINAIENESEEAEIDSYLREVEIKCNPDFVATPLGVALILSSIIVIAALLFTSTRRFYKH